MNWCTLVFDVTLRHVACLVRRRLREKRDQQRLREQPPPPPRRRLRRRTLLRVKLSTQVSGERAARPAAAAETVGSDKETLLRWLGNTWTVGRSGCLATDYETRKLLACSSFSCSSDSSGGDRPPRQGWAEAGRTADGLH